MSDDPPLSGSCQVLTIQLMLGLASALATVPSYCSRAVSVPDPYSLHPLSFEFGNAPALTFVLPSPIP